ncbi:MAG TPA: LysR family transcriptional regulator [Candidatus Angelobacter sp.]|nr:LysR family transcriptional regulator [Candidatus Angelobacter sp.]
MNAPLDARQIRAFCVLARTGSYTQAARELHLTQSGVSHSMKALESDVGCRLFDKLGKKIVLTQAGEQLLQHATKILQEMENAREALAHLGKWGRGRLRLGASTTACQYILPTVLREFKESFPDHNITIDPGDSPAMVASLLRQRIDLALALEVENEPQLEFHPLFNDELQFIMAPMHPWAQARRVERVEIPRQNYILYNKASITFRLIDGYFRHEDVVLNTVIELGSMEAIKELVKLGLGVSIVSPWIAREEIEEGSVVALPLGRRRLRRRWGILHWRGKRLNLAEETFMGLCEAACAPFNTAADQQPVTGVG